MDATTVDVAGTDPVKVAGWAGQTFGERVFSVTVFGLSTVATALFAYYLFTEPARLVEVWEWVRSLPLLARLVVWLLCLPWMIALWVWAMPWALAVRMAIVLCLLAFTEYLMWPVK